MHKITLRNWFKLSIQAYVLPVKKTYQTLTGNYQTHNFKAVMLAALGTSLVLFCIFLAVTLAAKPNPDEAGFGILSIFFILLLIIPLALILNAFLLHTLTRKVFHKKSDHETWLLITTAIFSPMLILAAAASLIPVVGGVISLCFLALGLVAQMVAVSALSRAALWQAFIIVVFSFIGMLILGLLVLYMMGGIESGLRRL